jgi:hypothetical protein
MIETHLDSLRSHVDDAPVRALNVSGWSVGQHLHHCGLAMVGICEELAASTPPMPCVPFSVPRLMVLGTGRIPRGRAKAPESVLPEAEPGVAMVREILDRSQHGLDNAAGLADTAWFNHPFLGPMSRRTTLRFIAIHNRHHLRLIQSIIKAAPAS